MRVYHRTLSIIKKYTQKPMNIHRFQKYMDAPPLPIFWEIGNKLI